jgi:hypothetical protein
MVVELWFIRILTGSVDGLILPSVVDGVGIAQHQPLATPLGFDGLARVLY